MKNSELAVSITSKGELIITDLLKEKDVAWFHKHKD